MEKEQWAEPNPVQDCGEEIEQEQIRRADQRNIRELSQKLNNVPNFKRQNFKMPNVRSVRGAGRGR